MSKTAAITIILVALLLLGGGLAYWYYNLTDRAAAPTETPNIDDNENLFPFGANTDGTPKTSNEADTEVTSGVVATPEVYEISSASISGFMNLFNTQIGPHTRFVEQETGHVYEAELSTISKKRISNTTIPKTREVIWLPRGLGFIARYMGDNGLIQSFAANIVPPNTKDAEGSLSGRFLPEALADVSLVTSITGSTTAKNPAKIFYLSQNSEGINGFISNSDGTKPAKVFASPLNEWLSFPISENIVYLQTKSSGYASSFLFSLDTKSGVTTKLFGNIIGLSVLPNKKGDVVLYSETSSGVPRLNVYNVSKKTATSLSLTTFAEKCVWSDILNTRVICLVPTNFPLNVYPDAWYQGKVAFRDNVWEINTETGETKELVDLNDNSYFFDGELPRLGDKDAYLVLRHKTNGSLWSVRLPQ